MMDWIGLRRYSVAGAFALRSFFRPTPTDERQRRGDSDGQRVVVGTAPRTSLQPPDGATQGESSAAVGRAPVVVLLSQQPGRADVVRMRQGECRALRRGGARKEAR